MADLEERIAQLGAADLLTITERVNTLIDQHEEAKNTAWRLRMPGTAYNAGDKVIIPGVGNFDKILRCETAGITADTDFPEDYNTIEVGSVVNDGTVAWGVVNLVTMPDIEDAPVTSVNGKTGDVNLTAKAVGAEPSGSISSHNTATDAHEAAFDNHRAELASESESGHVKVDGQTIVSEDGVIKAVGGLAIGSIFPFPASIPPEGAYLLNGQTIANCKTLYPKFWQWLTENAGEMVETPVYKAWTMPALTADGTVGGADYAAEASGAVTSGYNAYKSFDGTFGGASTYCALTGVNTGWVTYYSPKKLKLTSVLFQNSTAGTAAKRPATIVISGSNDNAEWDELATVTYASTANSATQTEVIPESKYSVDTPGYQYFKFDFVNGGGAGIEAPEITLYGQEYLYTDYTGTGNILTMSRDAYEYTLARTGVCGGFVIDSAAGSVRLPTWSGYMPNFKNSTIPVGGNGMTLGLTNGEVYVGLTKQTNIGTHGSSVLAYGQPVNNTDGSAANATKVGFYGITEDSSKSGIVADVSGLEKDRFHWCIQVFNAATALSEQESAQLASEMQMKMQTNLANGSKATQTAVDNVMPDAMDYIIESWNDGNGNWYRKCRSGWVEQGGIQDGANQMTVTLLLEFTDENYRVRVTPRGNSSRAYTSGAYDLTTTGFSVYCGTGTNTGVSASFGGELEWEAKGYAAN